MVLEAGVSSCITVERGTSDVVAGFVVRSNKELGALWNELPRVESRNGRE